MAALAYSGESSLVNFGPLPRPLGGVENGLGKNGKLAMLSANPMGMQDGLAFFGPIVRPGVRRRAWISLVK